MQEIHDSLLFCAYIYFDKFNMQILCQNKQAISWMNTPFAKLRPKYSSLLFFSLTLHYYLIVYFVYLFIYCRVKIRTIDLKITCP